MLQSHAGGAAGRAVVLETGFGVEISLEGSWSGFGSRGIGTQPWLGLGLDGLGIIDQDQSRLS